MPCALCRGTTCLGLFPAALTGYRRHMVFTALETRQLRSGGHVRLVLGETLRLSGPDQLTQPRGPSVTVREGAMWLERTRGEPRVPGEADTAAEGNP